MISSKKSLNSLPFKGRGRVGMGFLQLLQTITPSPSQPPPEGGGIDILFYEFIMNRRGKVCISGYDFII